MTNTKKDKQHTKPHRRWTLVKTVSIIAVVGWIAATGLILDKIYVQSLNSSLNVALVRSHTERHALSLELERVSAELNAVLSRIERYQIQDAQAAANQASHAN